VTSTHPRPKRPLDEAAGRSTLGAPGFVARAALVGATITTIAGALAGIPTRDLMRLVVLLVPSALVAVAGAAGAPRLLANRPMRHRLVAVAVTGVATALASLVVVVGLMFVSDHDATLAAVMLLYSGALGTALAIALSNASTDAVSRLSRAAEELGRGGLGERVGVLDADLELQLLASSIDAMAAKLEASHERERDLEARRRDLITAVSHDLRTPLASLQAMVEAVDDGVVSDPPSLRRYVSEMRRSVGSLSRRVDDLFEFAQLDAGAIDVETVRIRVEDLVRTAVSEVEAQADEKGLLLETSLGNAHDVLCSPRLLRVLENLLQNAVRHTPADGAVRVEAARDRTGVTLAVEDSGEGIATESLVHVFEPFWRGDPARSRSGSGLGLALAKRIVEALGGRIEVRSVVAQGSRFAVWVPTGAADSPS
jgi:signal transduction histidine kinase